MAAPPGTGVSRLARALPGGEQYIGIASGYGGAAPVWVGEMAALTKTVTPGGSFWGTRA